MRRRWKKWCVLAWLPALLFAADGCVPREGTGEQGRAARARRRIMEMPAEEPVALPEAEPLVEPAVRESERFTWPPAEGAEVEEPAQPAGEVKKEAAPAAEEEIEWPVAEEPQ